MPSGGDQLLDTIEAAHAAGLDEARWPDALASVARLFGARAASLEDFVKRPMAVRYLKTAGLPPQGETVYLDHYAHNNSRAQYAFKNLSKRFICDYEFADERAMDRDPFYTKYLGSLDLRYFLSGQIANAADHQAIVSIQRTRRQGHVERGEIERMALLLPHLRQAYDVSSRLRCAVGRTQMLEDALGQLGDGVALLDRDSKVLHANDVFAAMAGRGDGLRIARGSVEFAAAAVQSSFVQSLAALRRCADGDPRFAAAADFLVPRAQGAPAYVASLRPLAGAHRHAHGAIAMLFIRDPAARDSSAARTLIELFGLTEAEAAVAAALRAGVSPADYARSRAVSVNTVYTQLRRIKEKTGASRLPELIRKLNGVEGPLR